MGFKGIFENKSSVLKTGIFFLLIFVSAILHYFLALSLLSIFTDNGIALLQNQDLSNQVSVDNLKFIQLFSGLGLFITPTLIYSYLTNFDFQFNIIARQSIILVFAIMILITPFIEMILEWNMTIPFPKWILKFDSNSEAFVDAFLQMSSITDLFYTMLVIAVVPAIGEELLFRGYLQQKFSNRLSNYHIAILITAFLFSAIHFDLQAIIPRFVLGVLLGYLYFWSRSIWLPILAHFINNAQVVILSFSKFKVRVLEESILSDKSVDPIMGMFSFASVLLLLYILYQTTTYKQD